MSDCTPGAGPEKPERSKSFLRARGYALALLAVAAGLGLRLGLTAQVGPGLPTYITFYPAVMIVALMGGFGPGLAATIATALVVDFWILPPAGVFAFERPVDLVGLVLFVVMGAFMSVVAESYRRGREKTAAHEKEMAVLESQKQRRIAAVLENERKRLNGVLDMLPAYVVLLSPDYHVPFANRFFEERFGKANGRRCYEYLFNRTSPCEKCDTYSVLKTNAPHRWEWLGPDGHNYDIYDFPFTDTDGSPMIMEAGLDITEIKRAQAALKEVNEKLEQRVAERTEEYRSLFEHMLDGFAYCRMLYDHGAPQDFVYLSVNHAFERLTGLKAVEGKRVSEVIPGIHQSNPEILQIYGRVAATRQPEKFETYLEPLRMWLSISVYSPAKDHFVAVFDNITERRRAEQDLRQTAARQQFLLRLGDALRPLADPLEVQEVAARVLGEHLHADRVAYFEVNDEDYVIQRDYTASVPHLAGRYPTASFGPRLLGKYRAGQTAVAGDVETDPQLAPAQKAAFAAIQTRAYVGVPLVKRGKFVAGLAVHMAGPRIWTPAEVSLIEETAERTWAAGERARAEAETLRLFALIQQERDRLSSLINSMSDEVWFADTDKKFTLANPSALREFGPAAAGIEVEKLAASLQVFRPDGTLRPLEETPPLRALQGEIVTHHEEVIRRAGSTDLRYRQVSAAPVKDSSGTIIGSVSVVRDITEQKRAEANQALLRDTLQILNRGGDLHHLVRDVLALIRERTGFSAVGLRLREGEDCPYYAQNGFPEDFLRQENLLCGRDPKSGAPLRDAQGLPLLECACGLILSGKADCAPSCFTNAGSFWTNTASELLALPGAADPGITPRNRCIHDGYQSIGLFPLRTGQEIFGLLQLNDRHAGRFTPELVRFYENLAQNIGLAIQRCIAQNALEAAQEQLRHHAENLQKTVQERTAKLQELVGDLEHFSYTLVHDMRAPLRTMRSFGDLILEQCASCDKSEPRDYLQRIMASAGRMDGLITDALSFTKTVRQELPLEPVDAGALLRGLLDSYPEFQTSKADISIEGEVPLVLANEAGLTQCFSNLLGNAVKFVQPGKRARVRIRAEQKGDRVKLWFEDNGIGIPVEALSKVFDMFHRAHKHYEGTGIGLALVRKVAQRMGGTAGVESEVGMGSKFWIELRACDSIINA